MKTTNYKLEMKDWADGCHAALSETPMPDLPDDASDIYLAAYIYVSTGIIEPAIEADQDPNPAMIGGLPWAPDEARRISRLLEHEDKPAEVIVIGFAMSVARTYIAAK